MNAKKILIPVGCAAACLALGSASGLFTLNEIKGWYQTIEKPSWNPPNWLFGPVWSTLYVLMGIALGIVINSRDKKRNPAIIIFSIQFILNLLWSYIFFKLHDISLALIEIVALWICIVLSTTMFFRIRNIAGYLLIPYLLWVSFATVLTASIWLLNS